MVIGRTLDLTRPAFALDIDAVMHASPIRRRVGGRAAHGFTLIEAALATVIIGVGVVAAMQAFGAGTRLNKSAAHMTSAMLLANNIQEVTATLPFHDPIFGRSTFGPESGENLAAYNDLDDFENTTFSPPIDTSRQSISGMSQYSQQVTILPVYANKLNSNADESSLEIPKSTYTGAVRVQVRVLYRATPLDQPYEVYRISWIRVDG
jgi:type II secretory pathway pseudopilin PulG